MSTVTQPITVKEHDRRIEAGIIGEHDRVELIEGRLVPKMGLRQHLPVAPGPCPFAPESGRV